MSDVPSNLIPTRITGLPEYLGTSTLGYLPYVFEGNTYKVQFANIAAVGAVPSSREINTGSGLGGGGDLSANRTLFILPGGVNDSMLTTTGVTAGNYGAADSVPVLTINAQGRVTAATSAPIVLANYVPTSRTITAGAGLTGGGDLSANRSFAVNFSSTTPEPLGPGSPGVSTVAARGDHVHPAVDLSDTTETQGVLPLSRGGTGNSLSPVVGAIAYSSNDRLNLTPTAGGAGQVLVSAGGVAPPFWQTVTGTGTVSSVNASGGTTGMTFTGGPITAAGTLTLGGTLGVSNGGTGATTLTSGYLVKGNGTSAVSASVVYDTGTNVGIGTASPSARLDVTSGIPFSMRITGPANVYQDLTDGTGTLRMQLLSNSPFLTSIGAYPFVLATNNTERMRITANGDVLVNTTTSLYGYANNPSIELNGVDGSTIGLKKGNVAGSYISHSTNLNIFNTTANGIVLATTNTERMRINSVGSVGIGTSSPAASITLTAGRNITGSTFASGVASSGQVQSDVTARADYFISASAVAAGTYPLVIGYQAQQSTFTGTVTAQYGFRADASLIGATSNMGFLGNIPDGTNRWNFYAQGTAPNYFAGNVGIGTASPSFNLDVQGSAAQTVRVRCTDTASTGYAAFSASNANGVASVMYSYVGAGWYGTTSNHPQLFITNNTERMRIDASGSVGIGLSSPSATLSILGTTNPAVDVIYYENGTGGASYRGRKARGTGASPSAVASGDYLSSLLASGYGATGFGGNIGLIGFRANQAFTDTARGTNIVFENTPDESTARAERMRIDASGNLLVGTTTAGTSAAKVIGMGNATAPSSSPAGMGQLYVEGGALKFRGSSGTVTTIAPA